MLLTLGLSFALARDLPPLSRSAVNGTGVGAKTWAELAGEGPYWAVPRRDVKRSHTVSGAYSDLGLHTDCDGTLYRLDFRPVHGKAKLSVWKPRDAIGADAEGIWYTTAKSDVYMRIDNDVPYENRERHILDERPTSQSVQGNVAIIRMLAGASPFLELECKAHPPPVSDIEQVLVHVEAALAAGELAAAHAILSEGLRSRGPTWKKYHPRLLEEVAAFDADFDERWVAGVTPLDRQLLASQYLAARIAEDAGWQPLDFRAPELLATEERLADALEADAVALDAAGRLGTALGSRLLAHAVRDNHLLDTPEMEASLIERFAPIPAFLASDDRPERGDVRVEIAGIDDQLEETREDVADVVYEYTDVEVVFNTDALAAHGERVRDLEIAYWAAVAADCPGGLEQWTTGGTGTTGGVLSSSERYEQGIDCSGADLGLGCVTVVNKVTRTISTEVQEYDIPPELVYCSDAQRRAAENHESTRWQSPAATSNVYTKRRVTATGEVQIWTGSYGRTLALISGDGRKEVVQRAEADGKARLKRTGAGLGAGEKADEWTTREAVIKSLTKELDNGVTDAVHDLVRERIVAHSTELERGDVERGWMEHIFLGRPAPVRFGTSPN